MKKGTKHFSVYFLAGLALIAVVVWSVVFRLERQTLMLAVLDVGQGDAIFIEAPNGNQILIDGGPDKNVLQELARVMPFYDRSIDVVLLTHPQMDHLAGLIDVLARFRVDYAVESGASHAIAEYAAWKRAIDKEGAERVIVRRGERIWLSSDVYLDILSPETIDVKGDPNETMVVVRLVYGKTSVLLTGDLTKKGEARMLQSGDEIASDFLKVAHHGSKDSSTAQFLRAVSPAIAAISVGAKNRYGHPTKETLSRLTSAGADVLRTDTDGTIIFESDGVEWHRKE